MVFKRKKEIVEEVSSEQIAEPVKSPEAEEIVSEIETEEAEQIEEESIDEVPSDSPSENVPSFKEAFLNHEQRLQQLESTFFRLKSI